MGKKCSDPFGSCPFAGIEQTLENFHRNKNRGDGRDAECKECARTRRGSQRRYRSADEVRVRDESGNKQCLRCDEWLPESHFSTNHGKPDNLHCRCNRCIADAQRGLGLERRNELLAQQNGRCAGCDHVFDIHSGRRAGYEIDHDHDCCEKGCAGCIRGLLCKSCNLKDVLATPR